ncbi:thiol:disulfide interchange protein [Lysobacter niastensis]|uniref:Thiol:disulfide interchange protein n=1 Tax=Lysobacter niastensis TaxID=380629 RepID=A0ABU1W5G6_9GAMM|nr:hypothetical protein [Lysobacter niastensis]MDR7132821.1 thiol:disulfide interchange protein [Lysobacter niastensis]
MPISSHIVSRAFALPFAGLAAWVVWVAAATPVGWSVTGVAMAVLFIGISYGLWEDKYWARRLGGIALLGAAILVPLMPFIPYVDRESPALGVTLLWLIPVEISLLASAYVLDRKHADGR